jgi:6-pyruvoyl-tetrahydropterin synthase
MEQNEGKWVTTSKEDIEKEMKSDYFIKKFSVIDYLKDLYERLILEPEGSLTARTIESLEDFSSIFIGIFKKLSLLRDTPNDKNIYKYGYIIQRIIEEFKILTLIMFSNHGVISEIQKM